MRLHLALIALTWAPAFANYACTICKGGAGITKPDGMVTTNQGLTASCEALTTHISNLPVDACADLQDIATVPCGCPGYEALLEEEETAEAEAAPSSFLDYESLFEPDFVCSICEYGEITKPTAYTLNSAGVPTSCQELHDTRTSIAQSDCARVQDFAAAPCGCSGDAPAAVETIVQEDSTAFTCNICGDGAIGNPDGIVVNPRGTGKTCVELEAMKANIPSSMCPGLQNTALEPCECVFGEEAQQVATPAAPAEETEQTEIQLISQCFLCGDGKMAIPDGIVTTPNGSSARCDVLDANPKEITKEACASIQGMAQQPCGCVYPYQGSEVNIDFECSICGDGAVTKPDGVVVTPEGQEATCSVLEANAKTFSRGICPELQEIAEGPCGCSATGTTSSASAEPTICHICTGAAQKVGNPENMVSTPSGMMTCYSLFNAGLAGAISGQDCPAIQEGALEECGCYVDGPTQAPSDLFKCPMCEDGEYVTKPDSILSFETGMTCGQYLEEGKKGAIDEETCSILQASAGVTCGCTEPPTFPTQPPTMYECDLCGPGREMGLRDAVAMLPNYQKMSCSTLQQRAATGLIHESQCERYIPIAEEYCGCVDKSYDEPEEQIYNCDICESGLKVTKPNDVVPIPNLEDRTCIEYMTEGLQGTISEDQCMLLRSFAQKPCGCAERYFGETLVPLSEADCFSDLGEIQALEREVTDTSVTRKYVLCPNTNFNLGTWTQEGKIENGQPFIALRPNVIYQCGSDGSRTNDCILKGGDFGLASYDGLYNGVHETVSGVEIQGLTFENQNLFSVLLKSAGDITFTGCAFKNNSNNVPVLLQYDNKEEPVAENRLLSHSEGQVVTFQDCVFRDNYADNSLSFPGIIENTFHSELIVNNCIFQDNTYGSRNNIADTGYAIRSFGPLTMESTCFVDNTFLDKAPVLVYGAQFTSSDIYVETSQRDLACEVAALFSSQDDMAETMPTCVSSDSSVCGFSQGPTSAPTYSPGDFDFNGSSATTVGLTLLPMLLALCLSVIDL
mmetsp:Transcript_9424/g.23478  ORF Transcript_9424/g.23478 Transcript_9424/m.23478 type:complete len:1023 (+) Transcript_9424:114-3182(+)